MTIQLTGGLFVSTMWLTKQLKTYIYYTMNVNNKKELFQNIALDEDGNIIAVLKSEVGEGVDRDNQYKAIKKLTLSPEGYLNIYND